MRAARSTTAPEPTEDGPDLALILCIVIPVGVLLLCVPLVMALVVLRKKRVHQHQRNVQLLEEEEAEFASRVLELTGQMDVYSAKKEQKERSGHVLLKESLERHGVFMAKYDLFIKELKTFQDDFTREQEQRRHASERSTNSGAHTHTVGSQNLARPAISKVDHSSSKWWPQTPATPLREVQRQLGALGELSKQRMQLWLQFQPLWESMGNEPLVAAEVVLGMEGRTSPQLGEELLMMTKLAHPLLGRVSVKPYGVLGNGENQEKPATFARVNAVVVDPAGWHHIGARNNPSGAGGAAGAVYDWLGLKKSGRFPLEVHRHFETTYEEEAESLAKYHRYAEGQYVIHAIGPKLRKTSDAINDLSWTYHNVLKEFVIAITEAKGGSGPSVPRTLRLPPISTGIFLQNKQLEPHKAMLSLTSLAVAFVMLSPALQERLRSASIELCIFERKDLEMFEEILAEKRCMAEAAPRLGSDLGRVNSRQGAYDWLRHKNSSVHRFERLGAVLLSAQAIWHEGYFLPGSDSPQRLERQAASLSGTRLVRAPVSQAPGKTAELGLQLSWNDEGLTVMEVAARRQQKGQSTCAVSAASAYRLGGGALSGGRHALEESWCTCSTLLQTLQEAHWQQEAVTQIGSRSPGQTSDGPTGAPGVPAQLYGATGGDTVMAPGDWLSREEPPRHIPVDGCILSPGVEIFRAPDTEGYAFLPSPTRLLGVLSVAMFNMNPRMADSPVDAPKDFQEYCRVVRQKFRAVVMAATDLGAEVLVLPDVGCGVFDNDPRVLGSLFGEVLRESPGSLKEVVVTGKAAFFGAARAAASGEEVDLRPSAYFTDGTGAGDVQRDARGGRGRGRAHNHYGYCRGAARGRASVFKGALEASGLY